MRDWIRDPWGARTPYGPGDEWPERVDVQLAEGITEADVERWVPTASLLHSNGDGIDIAVAQGRIVGVRGRAKDRVNRGRLDPKDVYAWQANASADRLTRPLVRERGELVEADWEEAMGRLGDAHADEVDVYQLCGVLAEQCDEHAERLEPFVERYGEEAVDEPDRLHGELFRGPREGGLALLRDLHDLYLLATECDLAWTLVGQAASGLRDPDLCEVVERCEGETATQLQWLKTRLKETAPQTLVVAS
jgi:hypothetical protein